MLDPDERIMIRVGKIHRLDTDDDSDSNGEAANLIHWSPVPLFVLSIRKVFESGFSELDNILPFIPPGIFPDVLKSLLIYEDPAPSVLCVRFVLKHWPEETFKISEIGIQQFGDRRQECLVTILKAFLDGLGHVSERKLRILDLRGTELGDMDFLKNYKALLKDPLVSKTGGQIFLDLNITYANDYLLWNEILPRVQGMIKVAKLCTIFRTGFDSTKLILDALDEEVLTSLVAKHLEIVNQEFVLLVDSIIRLKYLQELDLSCGNLRLSFARTLEEQNTDALVGMSKILHSLPRLKILNLSNNKLGCNLSFLLNDVEFRLESLVLKRCGILASDILFLESDAKKSLGSLQILDLAENNLGEDIATFVLFLSQLTQLRVLKLEDCNLKETHARPICVTVKSHLKYLKEINLAGHKWNKSVLLECIHSLVPRPSLISLILPNYGIDSLQFKFKTNRRSYGDGIGRRPKHLSRILEPVDGECSEVREIRDTVESYRNKSNGFKSMKVKMTWMDGMRFTFKKF